MPIPKAANSESRIKNFPLKNSIFKRSSKIAGKEGFTLIELLIVVAIIGILSTVVLANYNSFGTRQEVKNAAGKLKSELRKYQNFAISGQKNPDPSNPLCYDPTNPAAHTMDFYSVIIGTSPVSYDAELSCDSGAALVLLADNLPWLSDTEVSGVGRYDGSTFTSCSSVDIEFHPLNTGVNLECDGTAVPAGESVYIRLTNASAVYNVFVSVSGEIYDERQP